MKTYNQWSLAKVTLEKFLNVGDEVDQELFDHMLEAVPPAIMTSTGFLVGEPYDWDDQGNDRFYHFSSFNGTYRFEGFCTVDNFHKWTPSKPSTQPFLCPNCQAQLIFIKSKKYQIDETGYMMSPTKHNSLKCTGCDWKDDICSIGDQKIYEAIVTNPANQGSFD